MVDYSKWDNLDVSDGKAPARPQVHRFDAPQTVTIGGRGADGAVQVQPQGAEDAAADDDDDEPMEPDDVAAQPGEDHREFVLHCRGLAERALRQGDPAEASRLLEKAMRMGGADCPGLEDVLRAARQQAAGGAGTGMATAGGQPSPLEGSSGQKPGAADPARGGRVGDRYSWTQTKDSVEVNAFVQEGTRAKDVSVEVSETRVCVKVHGAALLDGEWEYKVVPEEDPDWEMRSLDGQRAVRLTVKKKDLPGGMSIVVWWRRALKGDPAIDASKIQGRKLEASESFAKAWQEAHSEFRERAKCRKAIPVDLGGGGEQAVPCEVDG